MKVSIIIPTIGRETLSVVLEALFTNNNFAQNEVEILVVFDGKKIRADWLDDKNWERVQVLETGHKMFAAGARNLGLQNATGEVIAFLGDDTIPASDWLERLVDWHKQHPDPKAALLGRVAWTDSLEKDPFHQWLEQTALFDYARLGRGKPPNWQHFYTSNVSLKSELLEISDESLRMTNNGDVKKLELFSEKFSGWGFEDTEFGYRLAQKGMTLYYEPQLVVKHDDPQTLAGLTERTKQARVNAQVFEQLHPELKILPRGVRRLVLRFVIWSLRFLSFTQKMKWWRTWKQAWLS